MLPSTVLDGSSGGRFASTLQTLSIVLFSLPSSLSPLPSSHHLHILRSTYYIIGVDMVTLDTVLLTYLSFRNPPLPPSPLSRTTHQERYLFASVIYAD